MVTAAPRLLITLCTYNERENIERLVPELHEVAPDADILIIDDNSPDGTGTLADTMAESDSRIAVLHRAGKQGLGTAILAGFREGIAREYDHLINLDADFSHHPRHIPAMRDLMTTADVAIGGWAVSLPKPRSSSRTGVLGNPKSAGRKVWRPCGSCSDWPSTAH